MCSLRALARSVNVTRCEGLLNETVFILEGADEELVHYLLVQAVGD